jgi:ketosteroid isomerase-like protein
VAVGANKSVVEKYLRSMSSLDRQAVLSCLTDDVDWVIPGQGARMRGKAEFEQNIGLPPDGERVQIDISRMTEEGPVVVAEGTVRLFKKGGDVVIYQFSDVFEFAGNKVKKLSTFTAEVKEPM